MKEYLIALIAAVFIFFRKLDYYATFPRKSLVASGIIFVWTLAAIREPWFIVVGLIFTNLLGKAHKSLE